MENWKACEERMEKTARVIQNAFDVLGLREAGIRVEKDEYGTPHLNVAIGTYIWPHESYNLPPACQTIADVAQEMRDKFWSYDIEEERRKWLDNERREQEDTYIPDDPAFTEEFCYLERVYDRIAGACEAALRVQEGEDVHEVYGDYRDTWEDEDQQCLHQECADFLFRMDKLYHQPFKETMKHMKQVYRKYCPEKTDEREGR